MEGFKLWVSAASSGQWHSPQPGNKGCATGMSLGVVAAGLGACTVKPAPSRESGEATARDERRKSKEKTGIGRRKMEEEEEENTRRRRDTRNAKQEGGAEQGGNWD